MKTVCIIQARMKSTRLPGKVMLDLCGKPLIDHVIERAQAIEGIDEVVLNVPESDFEAFAARPCNVYAVKNQEQDVLKSYIEVADRTKATVIMRITGDCPLLAPDLSGEVLKLFLDKGPDYCANIQPFTKWADGWDTEVFTYQSLWNAGMGSQSRYAREHVTIMMRQLCACIYGPYTEQDFTKAKMSVDTLEDFNHVKDVMERLKKNGGGFGWKDTDRALLDVCSYMRMY